MLILRPQAQMASRDMRPKPRMSMPSLASRWSALLSSRGSTSMNAT